MPSNRFRWFYDPKPGKRWAHWQANAPKATEGHTINNEEVVQRTRIDLHPDLSLQRRRINMYSGFHDDVPNGDPLRKI